MQIPRIYCDHPLAVGSQLVLSAEASRHILIVLRLKPDALLILFNGQGGEYEARLIGVEKRLAVVKVLKSQQGVKTSNLKLHLGQVISKGDRMDYAIQKAVELGVSSITPLYAKRCEVKLDERRLRNRLEHWQKVIIHACEQSGRCDIPILHVPEHFEKCHFFNQKYLKFICTPGLLNASLSQLKSPREIVLCIGSEGGWEENEIQLAIENGFQQLRLGPRVLRTETATVVVLTLMQSFFGDLLTS